MAEEAVVITFHDRTKEAQEAARKAARGAMQRIFTEAVLPAAQAGAHVLTGKNRASLRVRVRYTEQGVQGMIFSTSGYGGFQEHGFHHKGGGEVPAEPYIWPAYQAANEALKAAVKEAMSQASGPDTRPTMDLPLHQVEE